MTPARRLMATIGRLILRLFAAPIRAEHERLERELYAIFGEEWTNG